MVMILVQDITFSTGLLDTTRNLEKSECVLSQSVIDFCWVWAIVCLLLNS